METPVIRPADIFQLYLWLNTLLGLENNIRSKTEAKVYQKSLNSLSKNFLQNYKTFHLIIAKTGGTCALNLLSLGK